jgi:hypothetical protein
VALAPFGQFNIIELLLALRLTTKPVIARPCEATLPPWFAKTQTTTMIPWFGGHKPLKARFVRTQIYRLIMS